MIPEGKVATELEYNRIAQRIAKGQAKRRDKERLNLIEHRLLAFDLQHQLEKEYNYELVGKINALDIKIERLEYRWKNYKTAKRFCRA